MLSPVNRWLLHPATKPAVFLTATLPFAWLIWAAFTDRLGANPAEALIRSLGDWNIRFLVLVLLVTPLRTIAGWPAMARLRRMLGLFVFFYATMHLLAYAWFDQGFNWNEVVADIAKRPFILVGMLAWSMLLLLSLTSFNKAIRWFGARRWQWLHRLVYAVAGLAVLHFFWMRSGKNDFAEVAIYAAIFSALLGWRAIRSLKRRRAAALGRP
ncbi:sulfoxide reductase heme-binding subunit YedZ [Hydrogenophaga crassostreae]|uniref:Protein-methionine-sulfoxide reductase heme-binding subunit MsrQ n=1 Tax=Hydrogenophaga crassostreae TaxID=1763535 RepID=A0A162VWU5_9BURK|nr:protein-methionine-sulfoxide reductase heme-binding subunit MsrQ [Hydrogenophaga crassostreae]AOW12125.1 sulfoxide reductase heme-binding subunit YedZ [Hydrogenophaga crassostreae]OAD41071.1 sulfoxide reductase heme-binding subunit YedZ [Hydrogenophaga crassostreae]